MSVQASEIGRVEDYLGRLDRIGVVPVDSSQVYKFKRSPCSPVREVVLARAVVVKEALEVVACPPVRDIAKHDRGANISTVVDLVDVDVLRLTNMTARCTTSVREGSVESRSLSCLFLPVLPMASGQTEVLSSRSAGSGRVVWVLGTWLEGAGGPERSAMRRRSACCLLWR